MEYGLPKQSSGKESTCQGRRQKRLRFEPSVRKILWRKEMTTSASTLAWKIPWTEAPSGLQSMRSRARHDRATHALGRRRTVSKERMLQKW